MLDLKRIHQKLRKTQKTMMKLVSLEKAKFNTIEVLISRVLINSYISDNEFVSMKNVS